VRRRTLLAGASALPLIAARTSVAQAVDPDFVNACCSLAGTGAFPAFFAAAAHTALEKEFGADKVTDLVHAVNSWPPIAPLPTELEKIAQRLLIILYTGETGTGNGRGDSPYYPWALAWQTLGFTRAPGICGGSFGAWSRI
jgi:hypothetical protein